MAESRQSLLDRPRLRDRTERPVSILERRSASGTRAGGSALTGTTFASHLDVRRSVLVDRTGSTGSGSAADSEPAATTNASHVVATSGTSASGKSGVWTSGWSDFAPKLNSWTPFSFSSTTTSTLAARARLASITLGSPTTAPTASHVSLPAAAISATAPPAQGPESPAAPSKADWTAGEELRQVQEEELEGVEEGEEEGGACELEAAPLQDEEEDVLDDEAIARSKVPPDVLQELEDELLRVVSGSLMREPKLHSPADPVRARILDLLARIGPSDPEFVLKVALYAREELNIRTTSNFLIAAAASIPPCRRHLRRYLRAAVRLPSDWLDVAALYHTLPSEGPGRPGALPAALRRALVQKFGDFDHYQLAKYNREKTIKKKNKKAREAEAKRTQRREGSESGEGSGGEGDAAAGGEAGAEAAGPARLGAVAAAVAAGQKPTLTLKRMIRVLHIDGPAEAVLAILGKRYPATEEAFAASGLMGEWKAERAGKRMKLPTPETWETRLSATGNKAETWEALVDARSLPFMAMLRNLRNLILTGVSMRHHRWAMSRLTDEQTVANSRQLPTSFLSAFEVLAGIDVKQVEQDADEARREAKKRRLPAAPGGWVMIKAPKEAKGRGKGRRGAPKEEKEKAAGRARKVFIPRLMPTRALLDDYRAALDTAVRIATRRNVPPIGGTTVVLVDVSPDMQRPCSSARGLGAARRTLADVGILLGLMCVYVCEDCDFVLFGPRAAKPAPVAEETVLENWAGVCGAWSLMEEVGAHDGEETPGAFPFALLERYLAERRKIDNLIVLSRRMIAPGFAEGCDPARDGRVPADAAGCEAGEAEGAVLGISNWLAKYRALVNPHLLYVAVDLMGATNRDRRPAAPAAASRSASSDEGSGSGSGSGSEASSKAPEPEAAPGPDAGRARHPNDILVAGFSEAVLKFIAERGGGGSGQLDYVHRIDSVKGLTRGGQLKGKPDRRRGRKGPGPPAPAAKPAASAAPSAAAEEWKPAAISMRELISYFRALKAAAASAAPAAGLPAAARGGGGRWRTAAVFVSSTFSDMQGEREALVKRVFPELRERCEARRVRLVEVDLCAARRPPRAAGRGTAGAGASRARRLRTAARCWASAWTRWTAAGPSSSACSASATASARPPTTPPTSPASTGSRLCPRSAPARPAAGRDGRQGRSITELEMQHAAIARRNARACFLFRSPAYLSSVPPEHRRPFEAESPEAALRLAALKQALRRRCPDRIVEDYPCAWAGVVNGLPAVGGLAAFEAAALRLLGAALDAEFPELPPGPEDAVLAEREAHETLREARAGPDAAFVPRPELLDRLLGGYALAGPDRAMVERPVLLVHGKSGSGKSSLLAAAATRFRAHWAARLPHRRGTSLCVFHSVGAGEGAAATDPRRLLRRLCLEIARWCRADEGSVPSEWRALQEAFVRFAQLAALHTGESKRVLLVIDGLDALDAAGRLRFLRALPAALPVSCIVSCAPDGPDGGLVLDALRRRLPASHAVEVGGLALEERRAVARAYLARYRKRLAEGAEGGELEVLVKKLDAPLPLFLAVACEELRVYGSFEGLRAKLAALPGTLQRLLEDALARLEADLDPSVAPGSAARSALRREARPAASTGGRALVAGALAALVCARGGLHESELAALLRPPRPGAVPDLLLPPPPAREGAPPGAARLPASRLAPLLRALRPFLRECPGARPPPEPADGPTGRAAGSGGEPRLALFHPLAEAAVRRRYLRGSDASPPAVAVHAHLAAHFARAIAEPDEAAGRSERRGLAEAPRHMARGRLWGELEALLTDARFVRAKCAAGLAHELVDDYADALRLGGGPAGAGFDADEDGPAAGFSRFSAVSQAAAAASAAAAAAAFPRAACLRVLEFGRFVRANVHLLASRPHLALQLAANWPAGTAPAEAGAAALAAGGEAWVEHVNKPTDGEPCRATLPAQREGVLACALDAAGRRLAAAGRDGSLRLFDARSGAELAAVTPHAAPVLALAFAGAGGARLVTASADGTLRLLESATGAEVATLVGHGRPVVALAAAPAGEMLASASWDASVRVWDVAGGECVATLRAAGDKPVNAVAWSPDGRALATGSWDGLIRLWAVATEGRLGAGEAECLAAHQRAVRAIAFSPASAATFASLGLDGALLLWRRGQAAPAASLARPSPSPGLALRFSPDGREVAAAFEERAAAARVWDAAGARQIALFPAPLAPAAPVAALRTGAAAPPPARERVAVAALVLLPGREAVVAADADGSLLAWDASRPGGAPQRIPAHAAPLTALAASPAEDLLLLGASDGHAQLWAVTGGGRGAPLELAPRAALRPHGEAVAACAFDPSGGVCATGSADTTARVYSARGHAAGGRPAEGPVATLEGHAGGVSALAFAPADLGAALAGRPSREWGDEGEERAGSLLAAGARDGSVVVWEWRQRRAVRRLQPHWDAVTALQFAPNDSGVLAAASWAGACAVLPWRAGGEPLELGGHGCPVTALCFAPSGALLATGATSGELRLYDADRFAGERARAARGGAGEDGAAAEAYTGEALRGHARTVSALAFAPDGRRLFSAAHDGTVRGWTLAPGSALAALAGHARPIRALDYGPAGELATASEDGSLRLWEAAGGRQAVPAHADRVAAAALAPGAAVVASVAPDGRGPALTDARTGETLRRLALPPGAAAERLESVAWSACGGYVAAGTADGSLYVWDAETGAVEAEAAGAHGGPVAALACSSEGRWAAASWDRRVATWDGRLAAGGSLERAWRSFPALDWCVDVAARPAGGEGPFALLAASHDGRLRAWRSEAAMSDATGEADGGPSARPDLLLPPASGPGAARGPLPPLACCALAAGRFAAAFTADGRLVAADLEKRHAFLSPAPLLPALPAGPAVARLRILRAGLERDVGKPRAGRAAVAVSVLDLWLAAACGDGCVRVWRARLSLVVDGRQDGRTLEEHEAPPALLAEFPTRAPCTALDCGADEEGPLLAAGDALGHLYLLRPRRLLD